ncbi:MAG TPA: glycosyltransferase [Pyrinomonadaceae bacterium]|nr:glycosyltransferase [Pyrinomonadaceae bacterium]
MSSPLKHIKQALGRRLSLSSKLFLRTVYSDTISTAGKVARFPGRFASRAANAASARLGIDPFGVKAKGFSWETPAIAMGDLNSVARPPAPCAANSAAAITTSIIIPVFNKAEFTWQCLNSLLQEVDLSTNEIIVVDNASRDRTAEVLAHFANIVRVIRNEENRGFVDACNQGAAAARGRYFLFLNNDTEVQPGWLSNLVETLEARPEHGAAGSLFLYPDGTIQEAGAIVWQNGEAHHYGWGGSVDNRRFNFAREVDYCSAASLLIRKEIFERLGGFDRRFAPAYYEDIDLCFGVRSLGYKVIYQPASRVVHHEGATAGRDVNKGFKHFQVINRGKFEEKWRHVLQTEHCQKNLKRVDEAAYRKLGPHVLVFDERIPSPDRDAGSARMFMILTALTKWCHVVFVPFNRPQGIEYEEALWKAGIETADAVDYRRLLKNREVQAVVLSRPTVAEAMIGRIRRAGKNVAVVFDMVDAYFIRLDRESRISGNAQTAQESERYRKLETRLALASDLVWCNSADDKRVMAAQIPGKQIEVIPTIHALHDSGKPFAERQHLLFIGNMAHRPNTDAVHFFMRDIYPLVERSLPAAKVFIVGDNATTEILAYASERIQVTGYLPDIAPLLQGCRVFLAPLRFGAGVKGKVGEAMSYALPVVTTSIGAEGFGLVNESSALIADTPEPFAAAVVRLYSDEALWEQLARNSRRLVAENFTPEIISETINGSIKQAIANRRGIGKL